MSHSPGAARGLKILVLGSRRKQRAGTDYSNVSRQIGTYNRVAILWDSEGPAKVVEFKRAQAEAPGLRLGIQSLGIMDPKPDVQGGFAAATKNGADALLTLGNPLTLGVRKPIAEIAIKNHLPSMFDSVQFVDAGGLLSYGPNFSICTDAPPSTLAQY